MPCSSHFQRTCVFCGASREALAGLALYRVRCWSVLGCMEMALRVYRAVQGYCREYTRLYRTGIVNEPCCIGKALRGCMGLVLGLSRAVQRWYWECTGLYRDGTASVKGCIGMVMGVCRAVKGWHWEYTGKAVWGWCWEYTGLYRDATGSVRCREYTRPYRVRMQTTELHRAATGKTQDCTGIVLGLYRGSYRTGTGRIQGCIGVVLGLYRAVWAWYWSVQGRKEMAPGLRRAVWGWHWDYAGLYRDGTGISQGCLRGCKPSMRLVLGVYRAIKDGPGSSQECTWDGSATIQSSMGMGWYWEYTKLQKSGYWEKTGLL
eukprot:5873796-Pyramimonas_sp.AAC.1